MHFKNGYIILPVITSPLQSSQGINKCFARAIMFRKDSLRIFSSSLFGALLNKEAKQ